MSGVMWVRRVQQRSSATDARVRSGGTSVWACCCGAADKGEGDDEGGEMGNVEDGFVEWREMRMDA